MSDSKVFLLVALVAFGVTAIRSTADAQLCGKYRGVVVDVDDPSGLGRIKVVVPDLFGRNPVGWALPALPFAGAGHGLVLLPEVGDNVWIDFEGGDSGRPIWAGSWFSNGTLPVNDPTSIRALVTSTGHRILIDDKTSQIEVRHAAGGAIALTTDQISLAVGGTSLMLTPNGIYMNGKKVATTNCSGDCTGNSEVTVDEIVTLVNIALGNTPSLQCTVGDANGSGEITVDEIIAGVNNALNGCGSS